MKRYLVIKYSGTVKKYNLHRYSSSGREAVHEQELVIFSPRSLPIVLYDRCLELNGLFWGVLQIFEPLRHGLFLAWVFGGLCIVITGTANVVQVHFFSVEFCNFINFKLHENFDTSRPVTFMISSLTSENHVVNCTFIFELQFYVFIKQTRNRLKLNWLKSWLKTEWNFKIESPKWWSIHLNEQIYKQSGFCNERCLSMLFKMLLTNSNESQWESERVNYFRKVMNEAPQKEPDEHDYWEGSQEDSNWTLKSPESSAITNA